MRWIPLPKMAISLALALLAACILIGINETGYDQSTDALDEIAEASRTRASLNRVLQHVAGRRNRFARLPVDRRCRATWSPTTRQWPGSASSWTRCG